MSISLTPLEDKIIVKQAEAETQTASGLFIPDNAKEKPQQGEVLAVGPGRRNDAGERIPVDVKVGDKVLYSKYGGVLLISSTWGSCNRPCAADVCRVHWRWRAVQMVCREGSEEILVFFLFGIFFGRICSD